MPYLPTVVERLTNKPSSRQEVIVTHKQFDNDACLISLQFLIVKKKLVMIANFRSQCRINGRPNDSKMLRYFATQVIKALNLKKFIIYVNVAQYHDNLGEKNNYGLL
jgi:thymidylate synthase